MKISALDVKENLEKAQRQEATMDENFTSVTEFILVGLTSQRKTQLLLFVMMFLIYTLTILGNLVVILLVQIDTHLQTPMYYFLMHLSGLEICYVTSTEPQMLAHLLAGNGVISYTRCAAQLFVYLSFGAAECFLLAVMAYDRYLAICQPLLYPVVMDRWCRMHLVSSCWAGGFLGGAIYVWCTFHHSYCGPNRIDHFMCEMSLVLKLACDDTHVTQTVIFVLAGVGLLIPIIVVVTSYVVILFSVLQIQSVTGLRKAFSTCTSHLIVVTVFYGTLIVTYAIPRSTASSDRDKNIALFYVVVTPFLNPIIYTLRNKDVHEAVARALQRRV
ncbi:olfactory receptor 5P52-like [Heteronotia binoei]|uniref:olfactory receptor 5P52-like n=1 Tax=Heteronotia binoei TaxID=13085 RepID=UPI00292E868D|nr:olfactory receptor 5P52-like [Heteronotia binoei]